MPFLQSLECKSEVLRLIKIITALENSGYKNKVRIDFSIINDMKYYNGFVFKGFINGIPSSVLSGGQYDRLMAKMQKDEQAIGFAIYLDMLEFLYENKQYYDADTIILYDDNVDIDSINEAVRLFSKKGDTVTAQRFIQKDAHYKQVVKLTKDGVNILENNA